jgi:hypothetical protein
MNKKSFRNLIPLTAIVTSTLLGFGLTGTVYASSTTPQTQAAATPAAPVKVSMQELDKRVATVPALAGLKDGATVIISDDGAVTGAVWQGTYIYHPAGSVVPMTSMYMRWKDGLVALTPTPAKDSESSAPGTMDANFVTTDVYSGTNAVVHQTQVTLVNDTSDQSVLRIPDNAWLFRDNGNGQYTALVDTFTFVSGSTPMYPNVDKDNTLEEAGSQPVPVSVGYWQPQ